LLFAEAYRFDFFQAVRLLESMTREASAPAGPDRMEPVGGDRLPQQEPVRFRALASHGFPAGAVSELRASRATADLAAAATPPEMTVAMLGLTGPAGVLPQHYTTLLIDRIRSKDFTLRDFLDLFNHRSVSLFYRAWEKYRFTIAYERRRRLPPDAEEDLFTWCLYCLLGLGTGGLRRRAEFDDEVLLFYGGHFAHFPRSAVCLEMMLADYFELPVQVGQFYGQWLYLRADDRSLLPSQACPAGQNCRLGADVVIGERVWNVEGKFRVRLGPLRYGEFRRFLPSGDALRPLVQMVRTYAGPTLDFDVQLVLMGGEVPWCRLGGEGDDPGRLGWNTWIRANPYERCVDDGVFTLEV
jgi:type VI secretion system protein ImpH